MSKKISSDFIILEGKEVPYGGQENSFKKTFLNGSKSREINIYNYIWIRIRNYFIFLFAYIAPSNRLRIYLNRIKGVNIADGAYIGTFVFIDNAYPEYIYIEEEASINAGCMLISHFNPKKHFNRVLQARVEPIIIKKGAIVAVRSIVMPGVIIGENSIVSANSVVYDNVESETLVRGNPAIKVGRVKLKKINHGN